MKVTLGEFLNYASQTLPLLTYLNTDNDTFPKEYRFECISLFGLIDVIQTDLNKSILHMTVSSINKNPDLVLSIMSNKFNSEYRPLEIAIELDVCTISNIN